MSFLGLCVILTGQAFAQNADVTNDETVQDTITVWGTEVISNSLFLGEQELELKQADHLSDLLRTLPGIDIGGTHSLNSRINIRGLDDRNLSVYIDGALQTNYLYHHVGNLLINPDILKSADVQLGANTVTHGGIGGATRFETKDASELLEASVRNFGARLMAGYNSNAQHSFSGVGYGQLGDKVDAMIYFNHVDRDNFEDGDGRATIGSDGTTNNYLGKIGFDITSNQRVELSYDRLEDKGDYTQRPDMGVLTNEAITGDILLPTEYTRETLNLSYGLDLGDALQLDATYYMNDLSFWRDETNPNIRSRTPPALKEANSDNQGLNLLARSGFDFGTVSNQFTYGVEYFEQKLFYDGDLEVADAAFETENEATTFAFFVEDEIGFSDKFFLRPGVRFTDYEVSYLDQGETSSFDDVTFGLAGEAVIVDGLSVVASYTELFKGPELPEAFGGSGEAKVVNPDLKPQTGDNVEFGVRYAGDLAGADLTFGMNVFTTTLEDFIADQGTIDANIGDVGIDGYEVSAGFGIENLNLLATVSEADYDFKNLDTGVSTESVREVGQTIGLEVGYEIPQHNVTLNWNGQVIADVNTASGEMKEGYSIHNISARWDDAIGVSGLSVTAGIDNLFDETYTSQASRTGATFHPLFGALILNDVEPGRNAKVTLAKTF